jgi:choice-of-anchor B domain-containing protein
MRRVALAVLLLAVASDAAATDFNVTLLKRLDQHPAYNDCWGYGAPDGRQFAILGCKDGASFIETTDPLAAHEVAFFPGVHCLWRDIKSFDHYVYVVNDCSSGVQVYDMVDPANPVMLNEFDLGFLKHVHNIQIDVQTGKLYCCGSQPGMVIYDLAANPVSPPQVTTWKGQGLPGVNGYVHDIYIRDGIAHAGLIYDGLYVILDVSQLPTITVLSSEPSGAEFTHSTWTSPDGQVSVVADETAGPRNLELWNTSNLAAPVELANLSQGKGTMPHNPYILNGRVHVAYYERGYVAFDISTPSNPVKIGEYDTAPDAENTPFIDGAWGCYPFASTGFVYVSDINRGFFLLKLNPTTLPDPSGRPTLVDVWPGQVPATGQASPQVMVTGVGMQSVTAVHVGEITLTAGAFSALDDQVLAFPMPAVAQTGMVPVTVENAQGLSDPVYLPIGVPGGPQLASGAQHVPQGGSITHTLTSSAGDLQFLALSLLPTPSNAAKVHFAIGAGFSNLQLFAPLVAGPDGTSALPPIPVPPSASGLTIYWQFAAVKSPPAWPAAVSNVTITVLD